MTRQMKTLLGAAVFGTAARALVFGGPEPTVAVLPTLVSQRPEITVPPSVHELLKRQSDVQTVLVGPDNTCGYVSGRIGAAYTCNARSATCVFITTSIYGAVGCCNSDSCGIRVACVDRQAYSSSSCDSGCLQDTLTVKCTAATAPYCGTISFFSGIQDYFCDTLSISSPQKAYTTYSGETDGRTFSEVALTLNPTSSLVRTTSSARGAQSSSGFASASASSSSSSSSGSSGTTIGGSSSGGGAPIGAIVGGVVGGVAVIALVILGIFFLLRHKKKQGKTGQGANPQMQQQPQQPYPGPGAAGMAAPGHQSVYDPNYAQQPGGQPPYYSQGQYPSPQQQYPQQGYFTPGQEKPPGFVAMNTNHQVPDRNGSTSPISQMTDQNRMSIQPGSPTTPSSYQAGTNQYNPQTVQTPPTVHEAGSNTVGSRDYNTNHRGQIHEMNG